MFMHFLSVLIVVFAGVGYHLVSRNIPEGGNQFLGVGMAYVMACIVCLGLFALTADGSLAEELSRISWHYLIIGVMVPGIEIGFVLMYQHGWPLSSGALTADVLADTCLLLIGLLVFHDSLSLVNWIGMAACIAGVVLMER